MSLFPRPRRKQKLKNDRLPLCHFSFTSSQHLKLIRKKLKSFTIIRTVSNFVLCTMQTKKIYKNLKKPVHSHHLTHCRHLTSKLGYVSGLFTFGDCLYTFERDFCCCILDVLFIYEVAPRRSGCFLITRAASLDKWNEVGLAPKITCDACYSHAPDCTTRDA